jgi:excisionase family DNA binding protein
MSIGTNANNKIKAYFTPDEMAEHLHVSKATVYRLVNKRQLPFRKVGRSLRFRIEAVEKYDETESIEPIK